MASGMMKASGRPAVRGGPPRRGPASADRLLLDAIRGLLAIILMALALAGLGGLGALVGATGMPVDGPVSGFP